jgi:protein-tyrosine phosphatase
MAEAFLRERLAVRELDVTVSSSGLLPPGSPAARDVVDLMAARGIDVTAHRSRTLDADIIASADLILGMERNHLTELVAITPEAYTRAFTLPEFVRRVESLGLEESGATDLATILETIGETRGRRELLRITVADEIPDPMGRSGKVFDRAANDISMLVDRLVEALWAAPEPVTVGVDS